MEGRIRVALYGSSLFMAGLAVNLKEKPGLEVVCIHPDAPDAHQRLDEPDLGVILFEIDEPPPNLVLSLLQMRPRVTLIALDPAGDGLLVLASEPLHLLTFEELLRVIESRAGGVEWPAA